MKDLNLIELLKNCPKGMKLYTTVWGEVEFIKTHDVGMISVVPTSNPFNTSDTKLIYSDGRFTIDGECIIFPSKENRNWSTFHRPFQDGDILTNERGSIFIYKGPMYYNKKLADFYCGFRISDVAFVPKLFKDKHFGDISECRFATEKEKQKLFTIIQEHGYKWDPETKTLEKSIKPKFKVGNRIQNNQVDLGNIYTIIEVRESSYVVNKNNEHNNYDIAFVCQDDWELAPNKFDITTLKPFESKVLVRTNNGKWIAAFYSHYDNDSHLHYCVVGGLWYAQCIPYKGNESLLNTSDDCNEYYKTWK